MENVVYNSSCNAMTLSHSVLNSFVRYQKRNKFILALKRFWRDYCWYCDQYVDYNYNYL